MILQFIVYTFKFIRNENFYRSETFENGPFGLTTFYTDSHRVINGTKALCLSDCESESNLLAMVVCEDELSLDL